jgi:GNAT superfamily N-acetyltransferase
MSRRWPVAATRSRASDREHGVMRARYVNGVTIPLRNGDAATVEAVFDRLGAASRARRFCGAKPRLSSADLAALARVDDTHHVLVAYVDGDAAPAGIARIVRQGASGEIAFEVADVHQGRGIGSVLARELAADARAAGVTELVATVCGDNEPAVSLLRRVARTLDARWRAGEREFVVTLGEPQGSSRLAPRIT